MITCPTNFAWMQHGLGMAMMLKMSGPEACADTNIAHLLINMRFFMILTALVSGTPTFLSDTEWKEAPWKSRNASKNHMDKLLDIMCDIPGLRSEFMQSLRESIDGQISSQAVQEAIRLNDRLQHWHATWLIAPESATTTSSATDRLHHYEAPWNHPIKYTNLVAANTKCLYLAAQILVFEVLLLSTKPLADLRPGDLCAAFESMQRAAVEICRSADFHFDAANGDSRLGRLFILWPLMVAARVLESRSNDEEESERYKEWVRSLQRKAEM